MTPSKIIKFAMACFFSKNNLIQFIALCPIKCWSEIFPLSNAGAKVNQPNGRPKNSYSVRTNS